jgi:uncharacterized protein YktB (UPF0637 family)
MPGVKILNRKKMVDLAEQVMTEIDDEMRKELRQSLERRICDRLLFVIGKAANFVVQNSSNSPYASAESKKCYKMVKPVLDDCIDRLLGVPSKDE